MTKKQRYEALAQEIRDMPPRRPFLLPGPHRTAEQHERVRAIVAEAYDECDRVARHYNALKDERDRRIEEINGEYSDRLRNMQEEYVRLEHEIPFIIGVERARNLLGDRNIARVLGEREDT